MVAVVQISASPKQLSKLRRGHPVRIKPAMNGEGFNLIVHPSRYDTITRTFSRGKGMEIALAPEEILANQQAAPTMEGSGIFGRKFDKFLEQNGLRDVAYKLGDVAKPAVKAALLGAIGAGATTLAGSQLVATGGLGAGAVPAIALGAAGLGTAVNDYLDNPGRFQSKVKSNAGGPKAPDVRTLAGQVAQQQLYNRMNDQLGTEYGNLAQANLSNAIAQKDRAMMNKDAVLTKTAPEARHMVYAGEGLRHHRREKTSIMGKGMITVNPPALQSQPFGSNFQFQHTLPPSYQKFSRGSGLYA